MAPRDNPNALKQIDSAMRREWQINALKMALQSVRECIEAGMADIDGLEARRQAVESALSAERRDQTVTYN